MILGKKGRETHPASACFDELNDAIEALTSTQVALNAHTFPNDIPPGAIVYNLENIPAQVTTDAFPGHAIWDFSARNVELWKAAGRDAVHVPVGYHPSMERFTMRPWEERDIDVVFTGCLNDRRIAILNELAGRGLNVVTVGPTEEYGASRDAILARSKMALNMLFHDGGTYPVLRAAHAAANKLPMLSEAAPEMPEWLHAPAVPYSELADRAVSFLRSQYEVEHCAESTYEMFKGEPMTVPTPPLVETRWDMLKGPPEEWDLAKMYDEARGGPVHPTPFVVLAVPSYRETERIAQVCRQSRNAVRTDLANHGIPSAVWPIVGDSLICRMRQRACHAFLMSQATHMLFCDADIECITPECVRGMLEAKKDVVAGACPFKNPSGRTVANLWPQDEGRPEVDETGCVDVQDAGTGWMLISRGALYALMMAHPELLHWGKDDRGRPEPLFALFDTGVVNGVYQSEDFMFCHHWQTHGGSVYVYVPGRFRHWGEHGYEGTFAKQYGLVPGLT